MKRTEAIGVRVKNNVKAAAVDAAADDNRSVSSLVEKLLIEFLIANGYLEAKQIDQHRKYPRLATMQQGSVVPLTSSDDLD